MSLHHAQLVPNLSRSGFNCGAANDLGIELRLVVLEPEGSPAVFRRHLAFGVILRQPIAGLHLVVQVCDLFLDQVQQRVSLLDL